SGARPKSRCDKGALLTTRHCPATYICNARAPHTICVPYRRLIYLAPRGAQAWRAHAPGPTREDSMRLTLIAIATLASLVASTVAGSACPNGYVPCGTRLCCPK